MCDKTAIKDGRLISRKGGDAMEVKDTLMLMIQFATLVILILSFHKRK
ncbi:putative holin-like toxin [Paenibacillus polymyxa]|nr:putative holin-like toxin [Paenibacillus polymyxa]